MTCEVLFDRRELIPCLPIELGIISLRNENRVRINVSEFLQPTENIEVFWGFRICPENGIMEWWNDGILVFKRILAILINANPNFPGPS